MTGEDLAARLQDELRRRQNETLFLTEREGPLPEPEPWKPAPQERRRCSTGKTVFNTIGHARAYLERLHRKIEQGDTSSDYIPLYVAPRCRKCDGYHVTSKQPRQTRDPNRHTPRLHRR
jgi:hypothetical protein